jgi:outer membrane protein
MVVRIGLRLAAVSAALLCMAQISSAQQKVAVINLQRAVLESAEIKKASAEMEARYKPRQQQMEALQKELAAIQQQLQSNKLTPQAEAELTASGTRKQKDLQRIQEDLQADVERDRNDILGKSGQKMGEVVKKLAEASGYDLVVDVSNTVFFKPALEITDAAKAAYDKAYPAK